MFNKLYDNCFKTELNTKIIEVREDKGLYWHACKDTIFYLGNDNMDSDIGMMDNHMVLGLKKQDGYVWHLLDSKLEGSVFMSVNLHERFRKCQAHTAQHLISAILSNVYNVKQLSFNIEEEYGEVEYDFKDFNEKMASELQVLCNGLIRDDLRVSILYPNVVEATQYLPMKQVMDNDLRVVRIGALDYTVCHSMHVPSLRYLQMILIRGFKKTENGYKIKYLVGDQLLDSVERRYKVLDEIGHVLSSDHLYLNTAVNRLINQNCELNNEINAWKEKYYMNMAQEFAEKNDQLIIEEINDVDNRFLLKMADVLCTKYHKSCILLGKQYDTVHVIVEGDVQSDFNVVSVFNRIVEKYHLTGTVGSTVAECGGLYRSDMLNEIKKMMK